MKLTPFPTTLKNGASVLVRKVTSTDRHLLEIGFAHLSDRARYFRFLGALHSAISVRVLKSTADNRETLGGAARAIINRTSAKLRQFVSFHPKLSEINAPDQPASVWENEGGAIVSSVRRT